VPDQKDPVAAFQIDVRQTADETHVLVAGELNVYNAPQYMEVLEALPLRGDRATLLNLDGVKAVDSAGLAALVRFHHRATREKSAYRLFVQDPLVRKTFEITGLDSVLNLTGHSDEARSAPPRRLRGLIVQQRTAVAWS
jgi:anti-sigma B factor antagonist